MEELVKNVNDLKKIVDAKTFKFEVAIAFWMSVHLQKLEYA
jgi:hypothetical protein